MPPGHSFVGAINDGLEKSRHVGLLLTPDYFESTSGWTDAEWYAALSADPAGRWGGVVPILLKNCPYIPALLRHLNILFKSLVRAHLPAAEAISDLRNGRSQLLAK
jgi:TIR domain